MSITINMFVYYGVILRKYDLEEIARRNGYEDPYTFAMSKDLQFQFLNHVKYSEQVILGKEIFWDYSECLINLDVDNFIFSTKPIEGFENKSFIKLENEEEIKEKLRKVGIMKEPSYFLISSYFEDN